MDLYAVIGPGGVEDLKEMFILDRHKDKLKVDLITFFKER